MRERHPGLSGLVLMLLFAACCGLCLQTEANVGARKLLQKCGTVYCGYGTYCCSKSRCCVSDWMKDQYQSGGEQLADAIGNSLSDDSSGGFPTWAIAPIVIGGVLMLMICVYYQEKVCFVLLFPFYPFFYCYVNREKIIKSIRWWAPRVILAIIAFIPWVIFKVIVYVWEKAKSCMKGCRYHVSSKGNNGGDMVVVVHGAHDAKNTTNTTNTANNNTNGSGGSGTMHPPARPSTQASTPHNLSGGSDNDLPPIDYSCMHCGAEGTNRHWTYKCPVEAALERAIELKFGTTDTDNNNATNTNTTNTTDNINATTNNNNATTNTPHWTISMYDNNNKCLYCGAYVIKKARHVNKCPRFKEHRGYEYS